jgi:hypothetical protein
VSGGSQLEDLRRRRTTASGKEEAICTICELEGMPYVHADYEYALASSLDGRESLATVCRDHADQLDNEKLPFKVLRKKSVAKRLTGPWRGL